METAPPSPLVSSVEKTNGTKLSRLLIDGGTAVLRKLFDHYHPPAHLVTSLNKHYKTLNDLFKDGHLYGQQWYQLFPTDRSAPDSKNFDISLLFLLLTNVCGLSAPRKGWHKEPETKDHSREANLARIKLFRNKLYGHVTSTGIDTPTFNAYWCKISGALRGLGLDKAEIDRLKAEHSGEEDYIGVLCAWSVSERDIKSQLEDIRQSQTKIQQSVDELHRTIVQDSKKKSEEVHQVQAKTHQTVDEVRESQTKIQQPVDEVRQSQTKTQQTVDEVRQSQSQTRQTVDEVRQSQTKTQQTVDEVCQSQTKRQQTVDEVRQSQTIKQQTVDEVRQSQTKTQQTVDEVRQSQTKTQQTVDEVCQSQTITQQTVDEVRQSLTKTQQTVDEVRQSQTKSQQTVDEVRQSQTKTQQTVDEVRQSQTKTQQTVDEVRQSQTKTQQTVDEVRQSQTRTQQTVDEVRQSQTKTQQTVDEVRQSQTKTQQTVDEVRQSQTKTQQTVDEVRHSLLEDRGTETHQLVTNVPETQIDDGKAIQEICHIQNEFHKTPRETKSRVDKIQQTREKLCLGQDLRRTAEDLGGQRKRHREDTLQNFHPLQLDSNVKKNIKDIHLCFQKQISHLLQSELRENILQALVQKSEGDMLYAHDLIDFIKKKVSRDNSLPSGILTVYQSYFKRPVIELCNEFENTDDQFVNFLHALAAAREPLPLGFVSKLLLRFKSTSVTHGKVNAAIACVSALLPVQDNYIDFFHKLVKDWLTEQLSDKRALFIEKGHEVLSKLCIDELEELKRNVVDCAQFSDTSKYALRHGVQHMLQPEERVCSLEEIVKTFVLDVELVYAKLCVNLTAASEDIVCVQKQLDKMKSEKYDRALNTLLILLRKHSNAFKELRHTILQTLLNEGGTEFSLEASRLLGTKYSEVAHMKYVYKEDLQEGVQSKFHCANAVICFDVSPQLDYMVCECEDYKIKLWSLHTGKLLWKRGVRKMKYDVSYDCPPYRIPQYYLRGRYRDERQFEPLKSLYRSVVFHPTQDRVLPGILSHAFTFDGDLKPLFFSSECRFWVCSISTDQIKMLTDCPNDATSIVMWNLTDGSEISRCTWNVDIMSFAWSRDGRLLAISDLSRCIGVLDVMDRFKTLLKVTLPEVCGMIKFSPDSPCLYCLAFTSTKRFALFQVNIENVCNSYHSLELESCSETGYLLGDPFYLPPERDNLSRAPQLVSVLNKQSVLRVSSGSHIIEILYVDKRTNNYPEDSKAVVEKVAFSLNGDTLYVVTKKSRNLTTLLAWDISSAKLIAEKCVFESGGFLLQWNLVAVRAGVLVQTSADTLELWNFKLSERIRCWSDLGVIRAVIRLTEERVACKVESAWKVENAWKVKSACEEESKVIILDTTMEGIVSTVTFRGVFIAFNSKCHVITAYDEEFQMQHGNCVLWKMLQPFGACGFLQCNTFSPSEQYCVLAGMTGTGAALYVLYADSGKTFRKLCSCGELVPRCLDCKFVTDEDCVTSVNDGSAGCLRLFNVKSGDLLSAIATQDEVHSLAAYPPKCLIAVDLNDSFKVLQVKLPGDKHKKSKRSVVMDQA